MKKFASALFIALIFAALHAFAITGEKLENNSPGTINSGAIQLPTESFQNSVGLTAKPNFQQQKWNKFKENNPSWTILFDNLTGDAHRAFGKPIQINGYYDITEENVESAALRFLNEYSDLLDLNTENLKLTKKIKINDLWSLSYAQTYNGIEVLLTEVELRIRTDGKVSALGVQYYEDINIPTEPKVNIQTAKNAATKGLNIDDKKAKIQSAGKLYVLPVKTKNGVNYSLVYDILVEGCKIGIPFKYKSFVDAHSSDIVWRRDMITRAQTKITAKGGIKERTSEDETTVKPFGNLKTTIDGDNVYTDENGEIFKDISEESSITARLAGTWAKVVFDGKASANYSGNVTPGEDFELLWDDDNSHIYERSLYHHTNNAHSYYKTLDPESEAVDYQITVTLTEQSTPNAMSDLESNITFTGISNPSYRFPLTAGILYHEYGHTVNQQLYYEVGAYQGMVNMSCHEALADIYAGFLLDDNKIGYKAFADTNKVIRNLKNNNKYPDDLESDSHINGLILGGSLWDLREMTSLDYGRWISHYTKKMGTPDDPDIAIAFAEWFLETLITDDSGPEGDNDLSNGTPHDDEIIESFGNHNIGTSLLVRTTYNHDPLEDTQETESPYVAEFTLNNPLEFLDNDPYDVKLIYSTDGMTTQNTVEAVEYEEGKFRAEIPALEAGTIVSYYMEAKDKYSDAELTLTKDISSFQPYRFLVGYKSAYLEDFEDNAPDWSIGDANDNANKGEWEIDNPRGYTLNIQGTQIPIQPENDHTQFGNICAVTGAEGGGNIMQMIQSTPDGRTTLFTPVLDLSPLRNPLIRFYYFYSNVPLFQNGQSSLIIYHSTNGGDSWSVTEQLQQGNFQWGQLLLPIQVIGDDLSEFQMKFLFYGKPGQGGYPASFTDALIDDFEVLTASLAYSVDDESDLSLSKYKASPNPLTYKTTISFYSDKPERTKVLIYNSLGSKIKTIEANKLSQGIQTVVWDATDSQNNSVAPGMYFYKIIDGERIGGGKLIVKQQ